MTDVCKDCPYLGTCTQYDISPEECSDINFEDLDYENTISKKKWGEYYWQEVSYRKYTEDSLDYGDLEPDEDLKEVDV